MIKLIITASDELYKTLSEQVRADGHTPQRARDALEGFEQATRLGRAETTQVAETTRLQDKLVGIVIDMSLRAADTLLETLHSRQNTSDIPLLAVKCNGQALPLALRRLCTDVLEIDDSESTIVNEMSKP